MNKVLISMFLSIALTSSFSLSHSAIPSLCRRTPFPELCNSHIGSKLQTSPNVSPWAFSESTIGAALAQAQKASSHISAMDLSSYNERAKLAWADCLELYEDSMSQLNRSAASVTAGPIRAVDVQTWLSAALTNHQTCRNGFHDFNLSSHLDKFPSALKTFPKLLRNSLAINKAATLFSNSNGLTPTHHLPRWVTRHVRKLLQSSGGGEMIQPHLVVAQDGSGDYMTISEALNATEWIRKEGKNETERFIIYVKAGTYEENVTIKKSMRNLTFVGEGIHATIITGNKSADDDLTTYKTATFAIQGDGFIAAGITFQNTAGPTKKQAVALRSGSDYSVFYKCSFRGYQDTLYIYSHRQFYRDCDIHGTIDFIFGNGLAVLQNCDIHVRKPAYEGQKNTITAQARSDESENTGFVIHNSHVKAAPELGKEERARFKAYLGRPWKRYSRTVFVKSKLDELIDPQGWLEWDGDFALSTLYYGEYKNDGSGARTDGRVRWPGYHDIKDEEEAGMFSVGNFLDGDLWIGNTGVPYTSHL